MNIIRILVGVASLNAVVVVLVIWFGLQPRNNNLMASETSIANLEPSPTPIIRKVIVRKTIKKPSVISNSTPSTPTKTNMAVVNVETPPQPTPQLVEKPSQPKCIIQIDGISYDVYRLTKSHSGGNVFSCNTDMSAIFWGKHGQSILNKMQQYRI